MHPSPQVSLALPTMTEQLGPSGTYFTFGAIGAVAVASIYATVPETKVLEGACHAAKAPLLSPPRLTSPLEQASAVSNHASSPPSLPPYPTTQGKTLEEIEDMWQPRL